jgi:hypothetical protein
MIHLKHELHALTVVHPSTIPRLFYKMITFHLGTAHTVR